MKPFIPLLAATVALIGSLMVIALGAFVIAKRTQTTSLFVEDRVGFVIAKLVFAAVLIATGWWWGWKAIEKLTSL